MLRTSTATPIQPSYISLYASIRASFSREPCLACGSPLYNLLALPEGWGDNSPPALFDRLFSDRFKAASCRIVQDLLKLRKLCKSIIHYMHIRQGAAEGVLEGMDPKDASMMRLLPFEQPIKDPSAYAWRLFTDKAAHELEDDLASMERLVAGSQRTDPPQTLLPAKERPAAKASNPDSGVEHGESVVMRPYRPPHLRQKDFEVKTVAPESCEARREDDAQFWHSAKGANKEGKLGDATPASWKASWRSDPAAGCAGTVDKGTDLGSIEVQSVASTCAPPGSETSSSDLMMPDPASPHYDGTQGGDGACDQPEGELRFLLGLLESGPH
ncbi:hypothetical protein DUNSADRAFT_5655 [Dunaliella salina]|uniref:Uncharacterized protein n=1 Tax=Dunaliella salina TaxID=3046 RepID=A0ABQ7GPT4_DUNSA|nr:hypothetical protein DUNSADRAFT_5655 [Dunaliella salina]|eukprot:KAF5836622.1 hypothetical protein DUNSADRAFT_5655 [Dunaliella salina]